MTEPISVHSDDWIDRLRENADVRDQAIAELRGFLIRGLTRTLSHRYGGTVPIEDVVQEALIKILSSIDSFRGGSLFTTWAMSIANRIGISKLRRHYYRDISLQQAFGSDEFRVEISEPNSRSAEIEESKSQVFELLQRLIDETLSDKQRAAIRGTLSGLPVEEIADRLHSNRNAIYKLVHDAKLRLRHAFERNGIFAEDIERIVS